MMRQLKYYILLLLCLLCSTTGFADGIFSTTYGEHWVTMEGVGVTGRYIYVDGTTLKHGTISDTSNPGDAYLWCIVGSETSCHIYNKSLGESYQISVSSSATASVTMSTTNNSTFAVTSTTYSSYTGYVIKPTSYTQYFNLYGGSGYSSYSSAIGYWNSIDENSLWTITEVGSPTPTTTDNSDAGSSVSKSGYSLVFSSESADLASKYLTLTDAEKANCSGSFADQDALEGTWKYCPNASSVWCCRMGTTIEEQRQMQGYTNETLNLYAKQVTSASDGTSKFLTSGIQTKDYYKYGIIEVKAKCNKHASNFPAIWMMPEDHDSDGDYGVPWPVCGECDIMEQIGTSSTAYGTVHTGTRYNTFGKSYTTSSSKTVTDAAFHIYTLVWDESSLTWYIDGSKLWTYSKDTSLGEELQYQQFPYNKPYRIILNQAVGKNSSWGSEDPDASYTYDMDVAYVRIYQKTAGYTDPTCSFQKVTTLKNYQITASTGKVLAASSTSTGATVKGATADGSDALQLWTLMGSAASGYYLILANTSSYMQNGTSSVTTAASEWSTNQCADGAQEAQTFYYTSDNKLYTLLNDNASTKYYLVLSSDGTLKSTTTSSSATTFTFEEPTSSPLELSDDAPTIKAGTYKAGDVTYTRTVETKYADFNVPFAVDLSKMTSAFSAVYTTANFAIYSPATKLLTTFCEQQSMSSTLPANTPFIAVMKNIGASVCLASANETTLLETTTDPATIQLYVYDYGENGGLSTTSTHYEMSYGGTLVSSTHSSDGYCKLDGSTGKWEEVNGQLLPFREYVILTPLTSQVKATNVNTAFIDDPTGIQAIMQDSTNSGIYDIMGRKLNATNLQTLPKGIYILGGKKYIVK